MKRASLGESPAGGVPTAQGARVRQRGHHSICFKPESAASFALGFCMMMISTLAVDSMTMSRCWCRSMLLLLLRLPLQQQSSSLLCHSSSSLGFSCALLLALYSAVLPTAPAARAPSPGFSSSSGSSPLRERSRGSAARRKGDGCLSWALGRGVEHGEGSEHKSRGTRDDARAMHATNAGRGTDPFIGMALQ